MEVYFHTLGHKSRHCRSYNTATIAEPRENDGTVFSIRLWVWGHNQGSNYPRLFWGAFYPDTELCEFRLAGTVTPWNAFMIEDVAYRTGSDALVRLCARLSNNKEGAMDVVPFSAEKNADGTLALVKPGQDKIKSTPAGEYLTSALNDFDLEHYEGLPAISDGANKLLMLVLAAVIKAGASREHEILAELLTFNLTSR
ncbi:hypothetical protein Hdeb2414_s0109g00797611 [Helianthus debilis subsp. tardiflorus]